MLFVVNLTVIFVLLQDHSCVLNSIVGWDSTVGKWSRVEGTPSDPNPNDPYAKIDSETLFRDGKLTPSITILGEFGFGLCVCKERDVSYSYEGQCTPNEPI